MGKKRKIISKPQKFGRKFALHPVTQTELPVVDSKEDDQKAELEKQKAEQEKAAKAKKPATPKTKKVAETPKKTTKKTKAATE